MFEFEQDIVKTLLNENEQFQQLYDRHEELKTQVHDAEIGVHALDDLYLNRLKREKLLTKDKMAHIIQLYQREHV